MVDITLPNKFLQGTTTQVALDQNWLYPPNTDPGYGKPYRYIHNMVITPQSTSSSAVLTIAGAMKYTALDIDIGDWVASSQQARALRIMDILSVSETTMTAVLEDVGRYDTVQDPSGNSNAAIPSGACAVFQVDFNGDARMHSIQTAPLGGLASSWTSEILSRFQEWRDTWGLYYYWPAHGLTRGTLLTVAQASNVSPTVIIGTNLSPIATSGDVGRVNSSLFTWPSLTGAAAIVTFLNNLNLDNGGVVASVGGAGQVVLTASDGRNIYVEDVLPSSSFSNMGLKSSGSGTFLGKLIPVTSYLQPPVAYIKNAGPSPDYFYIEWLGKLVEMDSAPGAVGQVVYVDNLGNLTITPPAIRREVMVTLAVPTQTFVLGCNSGSMPAGIQFVIQKKVCTPSGTSVAAAVSAINGLGIGTLVASATGSGALQIVETSGKKIVIYDGFSGVVTSQSTLGLGHYTNNGETKYLMLVLDHPYIRDDNPQSLLVTPTNNQTAFTLPTNTTAVIEFLVNGISTPNWTYSAPTLTFNPVTAGYELATTDSVQILYNLG